ncbi:MAG TPA: tripartite tricarboxylate transporter substrate-binding protein, partial [Crenalkalicoccus sp.]|nr:tripartite tricarboxylate transporter substrate-binding protein [Crenalkalicoccus sp.]
MELGPSRHGGRHPTPAVRMRPVTIVTPIGGKTPGSATHWQRPGNHKREGSMHTTIGRRRILGTSAGLLAGAAVPAHADPAFPSRPLRLVVPFAPGGPIDQTARIVVQRLAELLGQPVIVDNRSGANGVVAAEAVLRAPADGYTLLFSVIHHSVLPSLQQALSYDIAADFAPVTLVAYYPIILVVNPALPIGSVAQLVARAKADPGGLTFGHSGYGGGTHLAGELFAMEARVQLR